MNAWEQMRGWWTGLPVGRRLLLAGLVLTMLLTAGIWTVLAQPRYVPLDTGPLAARDAAEVVAKLKELKVGYRLVGDGGSIQVPEAERVTARLALAEAGLPRGGGPGYELFDTQKFGATDADRRVEYKRAMEGELARAVGRLAGVQYANVKLALPEARLFLKAEQPPTAAVMVQPLAGYQLAPEQVQGIIRFVSSAIEGLRAENVTVIDDRGQLLTTGAGSDGPGTASGDRLKAEMAAQDFFQKKVQALLTPVFGLGNVVAQVAVSMDWDAVTTESTQYTGVQPKSQQTQSRSSSGSLAPANQPGAGTVPSYQVGALTGSGGQSEERTSVTNYEVSSEKKTMTSGPGGVRTLSVGVLINGKPGQGLTTEQTEQVRRTVASATGATAADVTITVLPFSQELLKILAPEQAPKPAGLPTWWLTALALALGVLTLLVLGLRRRGAAPAFTGLEPAVAGAPGALVVEADTARQAAAAVAAAQAADPEPTIEELLRQVEVAPERNRIRSVVESLIKSNPEMVAQLLKGWIGED